MPIDNIHLSKLLILMYCDRSKRITELRSLIRTSLRPTTATNSSGGDFYTPFWADAKAHVYGEADLAQCVEERIERSPQKRDLYPQLRDGFLLWWNERRRWTNAPFTRGRQISGRHPLVSLDATVKVGNLLIVEDGSGEERIMYPYFSPDTVLSEDAARLGLWLISEAFLDPPISEFRILDVFRGTAFSVDRTPFHGDESAEFHRRYRAILVEYESLLTEYN
ncbi:MAG: hypothetical protein P8X51_18320 [Maritimibacter sp.]